MTAISFLTTREKQTNMDGYKKLALCISYTGDTEEIPLTLEASKASLTRCQINTLYRLHPDMKGHSGRTMSLGKGGMQSKQSKQKMNTRKSTEDRIFRINNHMSSVLWSIQFLVYQGYIIEEILHFKSIRVRCLWKIMGNTHALKIRGTLAHATFLSWTR